MSTWVAPITWTNGAVTAAQMNAEVRDHATFLKGALDLVTNSTTADTGTATYLSITRASSSSTVMRGVVSGDTYPRIAIDAAGMLSWGAGATTADVFLQRNAAGELYYSGTATSQGVMRAFAYTGYFAGWIAQRNGDAAGRVFAGVNASEASILELGDGSASRDTNLYRSAADTLATDDLFISARASGTDGALQAKIAGNVYPRFSVVGSGIVYWGSGSTDVDTNLYRNAANDLRTDDHFYAAELALPVKAGVPSDGDFGTDMSGNVCLDTTNSRIYFRVGSTWKYASLT